MADKRDQYVMRFAIENGKVVISEMNQIGGAGSKNMKQIKESTDLLDVSLKQLHSQIAGQLIPVLGPTALLYAVNKAVSGLANLSRQAARAGVSAEDLQKFNYAAVEIIGTSEGMSDALGEFSKRLGEAAAGEGELLDILKRYNISLRDQNGNLRTGTDIMLDYSDAIKNADTAAEKLMLTDKGFGNSSLVKVFESGRERLVELGVEIQNTGKYIEDELIAKAERIDLYWNSAAQSIGGYWDSFVINSLDTAIDKLEETEEILNDLINLHKVIWDMGGLGNVIADPDTFRKNAREAILGGKAEQAFENWQGTGFVPPSHPDYKPPSETSKPTVKTKDQIAAEDAAAKRLQNVIDLLKHRNEQMHRTNAEQELYNQLRAAGVELDSAAGQQIQILVSEHQKWEDQQRKARETIEATTKAYDGFFDRVIDGFEDGKISAEEFTQAGLEMLKQILTTRDSVTGQYMGGSILSSMFKDIGGLFRGAFGFADGGIMTSRGPLPLRTYSNGGIARSPQVAIYGEGKRPEAYVPLPDGKSIPVTMRGGAQTAINVTIIDNAGVDVETQPASNGRDMTMVLTKKTGSSLRNGAFDKDMKTRYGVQRQLRDT